MIHRALTQPVRRALGAMGAVALALTLFAAPAVCSADELRIQTGPVLGAFDADWFTVACRTSVKAPVKVALAAADAEPEKVVAESGHAMIHRLKVPRTAGAAREYVLIAGDNALRTPLAAPAPIAKSEKFAFVAMGDSRTYPKRWAAVAAAALKARPRFVLFTGDMVAHGLDDASWDRDFFGPAQGLFAAIPFYCVMGNHDENGPLFNEIFYNPSPDGRKHSWAQTLGDVTLIGVDGEQDWSAGSENARWLEKVLAASGSKFIFLASHYPPWTSSLHGRLDAEGRPKERPICEGREVIMPLLAKYHATAFIAGHDHCYERSEPEGGVTAITTGGAGAPLYPKVQDAAKQNPWSKVFASQLHYSVIEISGDACTLKAFSLEGDLLDTRTWKARPAPAAAVTPALAERTKAQKARAEADIAMLGVALDAFEVDNGRYPTSAEGLAALSAQPGSFPNWKGPYIHRPMGNDPWGNPYVYDCPGTHNKGGYDLHSCGPSGNDGAADNIDNWTTR